LEIRHHQETLKELRKNDRALKDLSFQAEEDRKSHVRLEDTIDKLQNKLKAYKRQIEEAEEIAAINLAKFRKAADELNYLLIIVEIIFFFLMKILESCTCCKCLTSKSWLS